MRCRRNIIYFSNYSRGEVSEKAGCAVIWYWEEDCRLEILYQSRELRSVIPTYCFTDGECVSGECMKLQNGFVKKLIQTKAQDFLSTGRRAEDLIAICFAGDYTYYGGGRLDGKRLSFLAKENPPYPAKQWVETVTKVVQEDAGIRPAAAITPQEARYIPVQESIQESVQESIQKPIQEQVQEQMPQRSYVINCTPDLSEKTEESARGKERAECIEKTEDKEESMQKQEREGTLPLEALMEKLPEMKLPTDGTRRKCCRMEIADITRLPKKWHPLQKNHFLLHGYYQYHHILLIRVGEKEGERFAIGIPGVFYYREQYMAETFGFREFHPLKQGGHSRGEFGYWYLWLDNK